VAKIKHFGGQIVCAAKLEAVLAIFQGGKDFSIGCFSTYQSSIWKMMLQSVQTSVV
jgi:hypothetical protein